MKKMLLATALALLLQLTMNVYCSKQTGSSSTKTITHHSSFLELGRRKLSMQPKFVAARKCCYQNETQQTFVNGLLSFFITLGIYTPLEARVYCSQ